MTLGTGALAENANVATKPIALTLLLPRTRLRAVQRMSSCLLWTRVPPQPSDPYQRWTCGCTADNRLQHPSALSILPDSVPRAPHQSDTVAGTANACCVSRSYPPTNTVVTSNRLWNRFPGPPVVTAGLATLQPNTSSLDDHDEAEEEGTESLPLPLFVYFDTEARQDTGEHVANLLCAEHHESDEQFTFHGDHCIEAFSDWAQTLTRTNNPNVRRKVICIAHNFKGYDSYFVLEQCYAQYLKTGPTGQWCQDFVSVVCRPQVPRQFILLANGTLQFSQGLLAYAN